MPYRGVRLEGERRMFSEEDDEVEVLEGVVELEVELEVELDRVLRSGIEALMATCVTPTAAAREYHIVSNICVFKSGEERSFCHGGAERAWEGRRSIGLYIEYTEGKEAVSVSGVRLRESSNGVGIA